MIMFVIGSFVIGFIIGYAFRLYREFKFWNH